MADNYIKISQLPDTEFTIDNSKYPDNFYSTNHTIIGINELAGCIISDCTLPNNTIKLVLESNSNKFSLKAVPYDQEKINELHYELNGTMINWLPITDNEIINIYIDEHGQTINNVTLSGCSYKINNDSTNYSYFSYKNILKNISFSNTPIAFLELNDSTLQELYINKCSGLKSCILGEFDSLEKITITNTKCHTNIRIGKLSNSPVINLENNQLHHIEFIGNGLTTLTKDNCKIISQRDKKKLKSVCFINCNITNDLLADLRNNNVIVYNLKKAV